MLRKIIICSVLCSLLLGWLRTDSRSLAQAPQSEIFFGGGVTNLIVYPQSMQTEAEFIRDATSEALSKIARLFIIAPSILSFQTQIRVGAVEDYIEYVELVSPDEANRRSGIDHSFDTPQVCDIAINQTIERLDLLPFVIAHEIAHCMEIVYVANTDTDAARWWKEGIANWAAVLSFPPLASEGLEDSFATPDDMLFLTDNNHSMTNTELRFTDYQGYGSVYFWLYLTLIEGNTAGVYDMLQRIPRSPDASNEDFQNYLANELYATEVMQEFGQHLAQNRVLLQPFYQDFFGDPQEIVLENVVNYTPDDFTLDFNTYTIRGEEDVVAVRLETIGLDDLSNEIRITVNIGGVYTQLHDDGGAIPICLEDGQTTIETIVSRGDGDSDATVSLGFFPEYDENLPCVEQTEPGQTDLIRLPGWRVVDQARPDGEEDRVVFLDIDEDMMISVWYGQDIVWTRAEDGEAFDGSVLIPGLYSYTTTLQIHDATTRESFSTFGAGTFVTEINNLYILTDEEYILMTEINRLVYDFSLFGECLSRDLETIGRAWTTPDLLIPVTLGEDGETLYFGAHGYPRYTENFWRETKQGVLGGTTTFTITWNGNYIFFIRYESTVDDRDNCTLIYESMLVPYDGDFEKLQQRAQLYGTDNQGGQE